MTELFLLARIGGRGVAFAGTQVESVVDLGALTPVPRANAAIRGLAALRSRVVTVVDTGIALGIAPMPSGARRAVLTSVDGHLYALLVDALEDVEPLARLPLAPGLALDGGWRRASAGMVERDGEALLVLDLDALVLAAATAWAA